MDTLIREQIHVAFPKLADLADLHLRIEAGTCRLSIQPGAGDEWVTGSYYDPTGAIGLRFEEEGNSLVIKLEQGFLDTFGLVPGVPQLDLCLGKAHPYSLTIAAGASGNHLELGGLPLQRVEVSHGAGTTEIAFSTRNPERMSLLKLRVGAGSLDARNLVNGNFAEMSLDDGIASCRLNFGGTLQQDARVLIGAAISKAELWIPVTLPARVTVANLLAAPDADSGFVRQEGAFFTNAALEGRTPVLYVHSTAALGRLRLRSVVPIHEPLQRALLAALEAPEAGGLVPVG